MEFEGDEGVGLACRLSALMISAASRKISDVC